MNVKNNRKSQSTEARIEDVFLGLLTNRHFSTITVREICNGAGISRTSFYAHYSDVYDLMERIQKRMTDQLIKTFRSEWADRSQNARAALLQTLRYIEENKEFFTYFLRNSDAKTVFAAGEMAGLFSHDLTKEERMYLTFFAGGLNALLIRWLDRGCEESPEEVLSAVPEQYIRML